MKTIPSSGSKVGAKDGQEEPKIENVNLEHLAMNSCSIRASYIGGLNVTSFRLEDDEVDKEFSQFKLQVSSDMAKISSSFESLGNG